MTPEPNRARTSEAPPTLILSHISPLLLSFQVPRSFLKRPIVGVVAFGLGDYPVMVNVVIWT